MVAHTSIPLEIPTALRPLETTNTRQGDIFSVEVNSYRPCESASGASTQDVLTFNETGQTYVQEQISIEETGILGNKHCKRIC